MAYDIYERIKVLRARMLREGHSQASQALKDAVDHGYTGTEIFMSVRKLLSDFAATQRRLEPETRELVQEIVAQIGMALDKATGLS